MWLAPKITGSALDGQHQQHGGPGLPLHSRGSGGDGGGGMGAPAPTITLRGRTAPAALLVVPCFFVLNSSLNMLNRWALGIAGFRFPLLLTACHGACVWGGRGDWRCSPVAPSFRCRLGLLNRRHCGAPPSPNAAAFSFCLMLPVVLALKRWGLYLSTLRRQWRGILTVRCPGLQPPMLGHGTC